MQRSRAKPKPRVRKNVKPAAKVERRKHFIYDSNSDDAQEPGAGQENNNDNNEREPPRKKRSVNNTKIKRKYVRKKPVEYGNLEGSKPKQDRRKPGSKLL